MWVQKDSFPKKIIWNEVLDWVVINGVIWVEIQDEKGGGVCIARC